MSSISYSEKVFNIKDLATKYIGNLLNTQSAISSSHSNANQADILIHVEYYKYKKSLTLSGAQIEDLYLDSKAREKYFKSLRSEIIEERPDLSLVSHEVAYSRLKV